MHTNMHHSIVLICYTGICKLQSKGDYWVTYKLIPTHKITSMFDVSCDQFELIWRHFHMQTDTSHLQNEIPDCNGNEEREECVDQTLERVGQEKDSMNKDDLALGTPENDGYATTTNEEDGMVDDSYLFEINGTVPL
eukprot:15364358-Ditylum_brightwellii.AAC.1